MSNLPITPQELAKLCEQNPAEISAWLEGNRNFAADLRLSKLAMSDGQEAQNFKLQREACITALMAVSRLLRNNPQARKEGLHRPFNMLAEALFDFNKGANPDLLRRDFAGGKAVGTSYKAVRAIAAAACIEILSDAGIPRTKRRHRVAEIFANAGHVTSVGQRVTSRTLKGWFDAGLAPENEVAKNVAMIRKRISHIVPNNTNPNERVSAVLEQLYGIAKVVRPKRNRR